LKIAKFQILPLLWLVFKAISNCKFKQLPTNQFAEILRKKLWKSDVGFLGERCMGSKKLLPHISTLEGPSSMSPYKQIIVMNSKTKFTAKQHSVCAHALCSNHRHVQIQ